MEYRNLGNSGLKVSVLGLGGNNFGWWMDEKASHDVIDYALELGINYIDTADMYGEGKSEKYIGRAIKGRRDGVIVGTKFAWPIGSSPNSSGGSRWYIMKAVEGSLRRLGTDYIDLYQMHLPDPQTPIEETLRALDDLITAGKIRYIGCSNFSAWQLIEAIWTSKVNHIASFITVQSRYNIFEREIEKELIPCCKRYGIGVIPWGPLAGGFLSGKYKRGDEKRPLPEGKRPEKAFVELYRGIMTEKNWDRLEKLRIFAEERGHKINELAVAWLLSHAFIPTVIAGASSPEQLDDNIKGACWRLTSEEIAYIEGI